MYKDSKLPDDIVNQIHNTSVNNNHQNTYIANYHYQNTVVNHHFQNNYVANNHYQNINIMEKQNTMTNNRLIVNVYKDNLHDEFDIIRDLIVDYPYIAIDTEFPRVVVKPVNDFKTYREAYFNYVRCNSNILKLIQVGISLFNEKGENPPNSPVAWQFNLSFNIDSDIISPNSLQLLQSCGIDFGLLKSNGIDPIYFAELLYSSNLVLNKNIYWISFHGSYDFAYLLRMVTNNMIGESEDEFYSELKIYFPNFIDIKYLLCFLEKYRSYSLDYTADIYSIRRVGTAHQGGSDANLTGLIYFRIMTQNYGYTHIPKFAHNLLFALANFPPDIQYDIDELMRKMTT